MMLFQKRADAPTVPLPPPPRVLRTSDTFDGNDGQWSTFYINIAGDGAGAGQNFKILPSTSWQTTIVPQTSDWCTDEQCAITRGIMSFNGQQPLGLEPNQREWKQFGTYSLPWPKWWSNETMLPLNLRRGPGELFGVTNVGLGKASAASITFQKQYVVSYVAKDFFLGILGLAVGGLSLTTASKPTFFTTFAASRQKDLDIPSASYGYTAGAYYRNIPHGTPGNMVFGGYDQSRVFKDKGTSIGMPSMTNNTLLVGVQSILYQPDQRTSAETNSFTSPTGATSRTFYAIIDSTMPYLVLPNNICDQFAMAFHLTYDGNLGLYTVNDTSHEFNIQQKATVSFKIGSTTTDSSNYTGISLPYAAFDLQLRSPIVENTTNYFPIKKGNNGPYVLGRAFLQEAYIIVDYERTRFTVAPAAFPDSPKESLISIFNTSYVPPASEGKPNSSGISAGAIAGIVIGIVAVFLLLGVAAFFFWRRKRNAKANVYGQEDKPTEIDTTVAGGEIKPRRISELTGSEAPSSPGTTIGGTYYGTDHKKYPAIAEMSPESQPAELYSPPLGGEDGDYFASAPRPRRRGATRGSSGHNTPGTPVAELAGDFGQYEAVGSTQRPQHARSPSDTSLTTNIDEVLAGNNNNEPQVHRKGSSRFIEHTDEDRASGPSRAEQVVSPLEDPLPTGATSEHPSATDRRPSHSRGPSDTTINSESTAVSQPTPEELERWAIHAENGPRRPLSQ